MAARRTGRPVVIADVWDNPGGGVAGDGTLILRRMLERGIGNVARRDDLGSDRGQLLPARPAKGRGMQLRFGGKAGPDGGAPIDAMVEVRQGRCRRLAELRRQPRHARRAALVRLVGTDDRRDPQHQSHPDLRARHLRQSRHRPAGETTFSSSSRPIISRPASRRSRRRSSISTPARPIRRTPARHPISQALPRDLATGRRSAWRLRRGLTGRRRPATMSDDWPRRDRLDHAIRARAA